MIVAAAIAAVSIGCDSPVVAEGSRATVEGVQFSVGDYEIRYLEVNEGENTYEYPQPALLIPVTIKNVGEGDFAYNPTHSTQQMAEAQTPLLYQDPGPEVTLPPESKTLINGVYLEKGTVNGQVTANQSLSPGEEITDYFLFEVPDPSLGSLILSIPPSMHRGKFPVIFRIEYAPKEAVGPKVYSEGDEIAFGDVKFSITGADIQYVKTEDTAQGEGFSSEPLYKISYTVENTGGDPITFDPSHRAEGGKGASLFGKKLTYKRVKFAPSTTVVGQQGGASQIAAGDTLEDFVLFDRPPEGVETLTFEYPAALFGESGIARVALDYEYKDPATPKELEKPEPKPDEEDDG